jgi:hypothetical protein
MKGRSRLYEYLESNVMTIDKWLMMQEDGDMMELMMERDSETGLFAVGLRNTRTDVVYLIADRTGGYQ